MRGGRWQPWAGIKHSRIVEACGACRQYTRCVPIIGATRTAGSIVQWSCDGWWILNSEQKNGNSNSKCTVCKTVDLYVSSSNFKARVNRLLKGRCAPSSVTSLLTTRWDSGQTPSYKVYKIRNFFFGLHNTITLLVSYCHFFML